MQDAICVKKRKTNLYLRMFRVKKLQFDKNRPNKSIIQTLVD